MSWKLEETCSNSDFSGKQSINAGEKKLSKEYNNNNNNNNVSIEDSVDTSIQRLEDYIEKHERGLITAIRNDADNTIDDRMTTTRKQKKK